MSNKLVKSKKNIQTNKNSSSDIKSHPFLNKIYVYLNEEALNNARARNIVNNIISSCVINIVIMVLMFANENNKIIFGIAGTILCVISTIMPIVNIKKNINKNQNIAMIITEAIFAILFILLMIFIK